MRLRHRLTLLVLLALIGSAVVGLMLTSHVPPSDISSDMRRAAHGGKGLWVDQRPLQTAQKVAALAATREERGAARDALRVADHEVDTAFASALQEADRQTSNPTPAVRAIQKRIQDTQAQMGGNQEKLSQLNAQVAHAKGSRQEDLQERIEIAQAELALDQDALDDAKEDLIRAGGNASARLQRLWDDYRAKHQASETSATLSSSSNSPGTEFTPKSLIAKWRQWSALRAEQAQLFQAQREALAAAESLSSDHDALEQEVHQEQTRRQPLAQQASDLLVAGKTVGQETSRQVATAALSSLHRLSEDQKNLVVLGKRIQDLRDLGSIYEQWVMFVEARKLPALHAILKSILWIGIIVLAVFLVERLIEKWFARLSLERKQWVRLRGVLRFSLQAVTVLVVLLVIFGAPNNLSTVLGLTGAGLTVALKDFIVSLCGYFVLMGRHGVRVGDWVEINGVRGEVVELGLLRTILLETGNWTEAGHPTGRQVAFLNSFAVEGYYFNFTTTGQWLWDECKIMIPWATDPYPIVEKMREAAAKETQHNAQMANEELQRVTRRYGVRSFSAASTVSVKATDQGVEATVRYITRANEHHEVRTRLNHAFLDLMHRAKDGSSKPESLPMPSQVTETGSPST